MDVVSHGDRQQAFIHIDTQTRHLLCSISNRARLLGLEHTSSTIYQTRGPAWREAIVSNLIAMQRPHLRGLCRQVLRRLRPQTWAVRSIRPGVACRVRHLTLCTVVGLCRSGSPHFSRPTDRVEVTVERAILTEKLASRSGVSASLPPSTHHHTTTFEQSYTRLVPMQDSHSPTTDVADSAVRSTMCPTRGPSH